LSQGPDLVYIVTAAGVEELLVVKTKASTPAISFLVDGVNLDEVGGGMRGRGTSKLARRFRIAAPETFDSSSRLVDDAAHEFAVVDDGVGRSRVTVGLKPAAVANMDSRAFPVVVDPSVLMSLAPDGLQAWGVYVNNGSPYITFTDGYVRIGNPHLSSTSTVRYRSTAHFNITPAYGASVIEARLLTNTTCCINAGFRAVKVYWADEWSFHYGKNPRWPTYLSPPATGSNTSAAYWSTPALSSYVGVGGQSSHTSANLTALFNNWTRTNGGGSLLFTGEESYQYTYEKFTVTLQLTINRWPTNPDVTVSQVQHNVNFAALATDPDADSVTYLYRIYDDANNNGSFDSSEASVTSPAWVSATSHQLAVPPSWAGRSHLRWEVKGYDGWVWYNESHESKSSGALQPITNATPSAPIVAAPQSGGVTETLTPTLSVSPSTDADGDPVAYQFLICPQDVQNPSTENPLCRSSAFGAATSWQVPSSYLYWNTGYNWWAYASDGPDVSGSSASFMATKTGATVPAIAGGFNPYSQATVGVDAATGNFRMTETDVKVPGVSTMLSVSRTVNTLLASSNGSFGRGWTFPLDMRVRTDSDGNAFVVMPDGSEEFHGKNPDNSYSFALGSGNTLVKDTAWRLTEPSGTQYAFDVTSGNLLSATDKAGRTLTSTWLNATSQELKDQASERSLVLTYAQPSGATRMHVVSVSTASVAAHGGALVWKYYYDADRLTKVCDPRDNAETGTCESYTYDSSSRLLTMTSVAGTEFVDLTYDGSGRVVTRKDSLNNAWAFTYVSPDPTVTSPTNNTFTVKRTTVTNPRSKATSYDFDDAYRLVHRVDALGAQRWYSYDAHGFVSQEINELGEVEQYVNDDQGNVLTRTDSAGHAWQSTFGTVEGGGATRYLLTTADPYGHVTTFEYDASGNQTRQTTALGAVSQWAFTTGSEPAYGSTGTMPAGLLRTVTDPNGTVTQTNDYNSSGDLVRVTDAAGKQELRTFDEIGRLTAVTTLWSGRSTTTTTTYDVLSNVLTVTAPAVTNPISGVTRQKVTTNAYDLDSNLSTVTVSDAVGGDTSRVTHYSYDADDRQVTTTDAEGGVTSRVFDANGNVVQVTDPLGRVITTTYDDADHPVDVVMVGYTNPASNAAPRDITMSHTTYDLLGRVSSVTDAAGTVTTMTYDSRGNTTDVKVNGFVPLSGAPYDFVLSHKEYDSANRLAAEESGNGVARVEYSYDADGRRVSELHRNGPVSGFTLADVTVTTTYDVASRPIEVTTSDGVHNTEIRRLSYDGAGRVVTTTVENGATDLVSYASYDQLGNPTSLVDARGAGANDASYTTTNTYDLLGRLVKTELPPVSIEVFGTGATTGRPVKQVGYDTFGNATHVSDPAGNVTVTAYDRLSRVTTITHPSYTQPGGAGATLQPTETRAYDAVGNVRFATDRRGNTTEFQYDSLNRATRQIDPAAAVGGTQGVSTVAFDDVGRVTSRTDVLGRSTEYTYDKLGRTRTVTEHVTDNGSLNTLVTTTDYDGLGNAISSTDPTGATTTAVYSRLGRLLRTTDPLGYVTSYVYDAVGRVIRTDNPSGTSSRATYDLAGRTLETAAHDSGGTKVMSTTATYDAVGNLLTSTDPAGVTTTFAYDATNTLSTVTQPKASGHNIVTTYGYDASGNVTRVTDGNGHVWGTTYNTWGLVESRVEPATTEHPSLSDRTFTTRYDAGGLPVAEFQPGNTITRSFDNLGRLTSEGGTGGASRSFAYDLAGRATTIVSGSNTVSVGYNERNQLVSVTGAGGDSSFRYDADGRITQRTDVAGTASYSWSANGQLYQVADPVTGNTTTYTWAAPGTAHAGALSTVSWSGVSRTYGYDSLDRLVSDTVAGSSGTIWSAAYAYDTAGRVASKTVAPAGVAGAGTHSYGYDLAGELTSWTDPAAVTTAYGWDDAGNRTSSGSTVVVFDERNRVVSEGTKSYDWSARGTLQSVTDGASTVEYGFDGLGRMGSVGGVSYSYDGLDRVVVRDGVALSYSGLSNQPSGDGSSVVSRSPGGRAMGVAQGSVQVALLSDRHGDVTATVAAGGLVDSVAYSPWGEVTERQGSTGLVVGFQGSYTDPSTGLVDMGARWYQPSTSTFTARDTYNGQLSTPISLNRYTYAQGDPLSYFDPDGHAAMVARPDGLGTGRTAGSAGFGKTMSTAAKLAKQVAAVSNAARASASIARSIQAGQQFALAALQSRASMLEATNGIVDPANDPVLSKMSRDIIRRNFSAFDTAKHGGAGDGVISGGDLEAVRSNKEGRSSLLEQWAADFALLKAGRGNPKDPAGCLEKSNPCGLNDKQLAHLLASNFIPTHGAEVVGVWKDKITGIYDTGKCMVTPSCAAEVSSYSLMHPVETFEGMVDSVTNAKYCREGASQCAAAFFFDFLLIVGTEGTVRGISGLRASRAATVEGELGATAAGAGESRNLVYRGLADGEDAANGLVARNPNAGNSPVSHVAGQRDSQWISTTRDPAVAAEKYGSNGVAVIDLEKVPGQFVDLTAGLPGHQPCMICNWAIKDQEVLIQGGIPKTAIVRSV